MLFPFLLLLFLPRNGDSARVLGVLPTPSYSHQIVFRPIWKELAKRGHEVVVITTDLENSNMTNIREIDVSFTYDLWLNKYKVFKQFVDDRDICDKELSHPPVRDLITNKSEHFDLVVVENMVPIMMGFAERFKCPSVAVTTLDFPNMYHTLLGSPDHPVAYPDPMLPFIEKMNFFGTTFERTL
ncbi:hypothetical protein NQ317_004013 [Molorchus minor]|uniref:Uncharacterized protein n=1 Tax=Molorchus minor TaxID=1323400 RepID=A0ABQ9JV56_9CUCU|nr:hypothetical protein NQ317_004013 [Molorchus minor]